MEKYTPTIVLIVEELTHSELKERFYELHQQYEDLKERCESNQQSDTDNQQLQQGGVSNSVCFGCIHDCYGGRFAKECIGCNNGSNNKQTDC